MNTKNIMKVIASDKLFLSTNQVKINIIKKLCLQVPSNSSIYLSCSKNNT